MRSLLTQRNALVSVAAGTVAALIASAALAGGSAASVFRGCLAQSGRLYNVKVNPRSRPRCHRHDKNISWSQTGPRGRAGIQGVIGGFGLAGPPGPTGKTGATGPAGPNGSPGPQGQRGTTGPGGPIGPSGSAVSAQKQASATLSPRIPISVVSASVTPSFAGNVVANGAATITGGNAASTLSCSLRATNGTNTSSTPISSTFKQSVPANGAATISVVGGETVMANQTANISLSCSVDSGTPSAQGNLNVVATPSH